MQRRYSEIRGRRLSPLEAAGEAAAASKAGSWLFLHVIGPVDKRLLPWTLGRWSFLGPGQSVGLLTTTGARSGQARSTPLQFVKDGDRVLLVASAGGAPKDPAWAHNLRAHPECTFLYGGRYRTYTAREAGGEERTRAWARVVDWYQGYAQYQSLTSRLIPVFILEPSSEEWAVSPVPSPAADGSPGAATGAAGAAGAAGRAASPEEPSPAEPSPGEVPAGEVPAGELPAGELPAGELNPDSPAGA